ncbi:MAG TPA: hypothetical protein VGM90_02775 [Kofleriaceae bacterium]|jgi:hypothetical protein
MSSLVLALMAKCGHPQKVAHRADGTCAPEPREGQPCARGESYCVLSWGSPGGASSALWCRGGRWILEEERNLD